MLDMGFVHDVRRVVAALPAARQTLFFSATIAGPIETLARTMLANPARVSIAPTVTTAESVDQSVVFVDKADKRAMLERVLREAGPGRRPRAHAGLHADEARRQPALGAARSRGHRERGHPRQQDAGRARARARGVPPRDDARARRDRRRGARHRRRGHLARRQLRPPERRRELRPPHRPHRPRGRQRAAPSRSAIARSARSSSTSSA